jgi:hypothetical protein
VKPFVPSTIDNAAQECWAAAVILPITLHEARHTFASLLIDSGANAKAVQEFMGHSKIQTTFDTYGHLLPAHATRFASGWTPISDGPPSTPRDRGRLPRYRFAWKAGIRLAAPGSSGRCG